MIRKIFLEGFPIAFWLNYILRGVSVLMKFRTLSQIENYVQYLSGVSSSCVPVALSGDWQSDIFYAQSSVTQFGRPTLFRQNVGAKAPNNNNFAT